MKNVEFFDAVNAVCEEKDLEKELVYAAIAKGVENAYKREHGGQTNIKFKFDEEKFEYDFYEYYNVVGSEEELDPQDQSKVLLSEARKHRKTAKVGDYFEIKRHVNPKDFGRIAINSTKQIFSQQLKDYSRTKSYEYFSSKQNEMITGVVIKITDSLVIFDLGYMTTGSLKKDEISKDSQYIGAKVGLYVTKVEKTQRGPKVTVSRSDKNLVKRFLEENIPEVKDGTIEIIGIARDPEDRSKICVMTNDPNVDALGACLGPKGKRIQDVINALGGEKIDLYEWSSDPAELIKNALKPAEVFKVQYDEEKKQAIAVVPNDQFSLAIGKKGQNVRLAVQSSGWKIDIKSVDQALEEGIDF